jgi:hypothetical protein
MAIVHFEIHHITGNDVAELDEDAVARRLAADDPFVQALCEAETLEGAIVIGGAQIVDDLGSATQRLCFESLEALATPGATYAYRYFTAANDAALTSSADGATITLSGDDVATSQHPRAALLPALYACGLRYLALLEHLGQRGRAGSAVELAHLRPFAQRALAVLRQHGLA